MRELFAPTLALAVLLVAGCDRAPEAPRATGLLAWDRVELTAEAPEPIRAILVREGVQVAEGVVVVQLDTARAEARLAAARAEQLRLQAALAELRRGPRQERIAAAAARYAGAVAALDLAERELPRVLTLARQKLAAPEAVDRARAERDRAQAERDTAAQQLAELKHGATAEELTQAEQALARADASVSEAQVVLDRLTLRAPAASRVDDLPLEVGERPAIGAVVAVLLTGDAPYARIHLPESLRAAVRPGTRARVQVDGRTDSFAGVVRRVSADPVFTPYYSLTEHDRKHLTYVAEVQLEDARDLPAGVPVEVSFDGLEPGR